MKGDQEGNENISEVTQTKTKKENFFSFSRLLKNMFSIFFGSSNKSNANMRYVDDFLADGQNNNTEQKSTDLEKENTQTKGQEVGEEGRSATRQASEQIKPNNNTQSQILKTDSVAADQPIAPSKSTITKNTTNQPRGETKMKNDNNNNNGTNEPENFEEDLARATPEVQVELNGDTATNLEQTKERSDSVGSVSSFRSDTTNETDFSDVSASEADKAKKSEAEEQLVVKDNGEGLVPEVKLDSLFRDFKLDPKLFQDILSNNTGTKTKNDELRLLMAFAKPRLVNTLLLTSFMEKANQVLSSPAAQPKATGERLRIEDAFEKVTAADSPLTGAERKAGEKLLARLRRREVSKSTSFEDVAKEVVEDVKKKREKERQNRSTQRWNEFKSDMGEMFSDKVTEPAVAAGKKLAQGASTTGNAIAQGARMGTRMAAGVVGGGLLTGASAVRGAAGTIANAGAAGLLGAAGVVKSGLYRARAGLGRAAIGAARFAGQAMEDGASKAFNSRTNLFYRSARKDVEKRYELLKEQVTKGDLTDKQKETIISAIDNADKSRKAYMEAVDNVRVYAPGSEKFKEQTSKLKDLNDEFYRNREELGTLISSEAKGHQASFELLKGKEIRLMSRVADYQEVAKNQNAMKDRREAETKRLDDKKATLIHDGDSWLRNAEAFGTEAVNSMDNVFSGKADEKFKKTPGLIGGKTTADRLTTFGHMAMGRSADERERIENEKAAVKAAAAVKAVEREENRTNGFLRDRLTRSKEVVVEDITPKDKPLLMIDNGEGVAERAAIKLQSLVRGHAGRKLATEAKALKKGGVIMETATGVVSLNVIPPKKPERNRGNSMQ